MSDLHQMRFATDSDRQDVLNGLTKLGLLDRAIATFYINSPCMWDFSRFLPGQDYPYIDDATAGTFRARYAEDDGLFVLEDSALPWAVEARCFIWPSAINYRRHGKTMRTTKVWHKRIEIHQFLGDFNSLRNALVMLKLAATH